jgi:hypothetical protein
VRVLAGLIVAVVCTASLSGCRVFRADEWARRDRCAKTLPLLREEPARPYRVIRIVESDNEDDLVWQACAEHAEGLIELAPRTELTTHGRAIGTAAGGVAVAAGSSTTRQGLFFRGFAIRYTDAAP